MYAGVEVKMKRYNELVNLFNEVNRKDREYKESVDNFIGHLYACFASYFGNEEANNTSLCKPSSWEQENVFSKALWFDENGLRCVTLCFQIPRYKNAFSDYRTYFLFKPK